MRFHLIKQLAATWSGQNKKLGSGILGFESDTGLAKIGDGATAWNSLRYLTDLPIVTALPTAAAGLRGRMVVMNNGSGNAEPSSS